MKKSRLIYLLLFLCSASLAESKAYQYYKPINDSKVESFIAKALKEITYFGDFTYPVKEIHLRHSKLRKEPRLYSRADITDWDLLNDKLSKILISQSFPNLKTSLVSQLKVIKAINLLIKDENLIEKKAFTAVTLSDQQKGWAGKGFWGLFTEDHIKLNRSLLDNFLKDCVNSFKFIKRPPLGMQLCELADAKRGIYIIYLKHPVGSDAFYCELAHELFHVLDPTIFDWHMEGLANIFSEHLLTTQKIPWDHFRTLLKDTSKPYGASYHMMNQIYKKFPDCFKKFVNYKVKWTNGKYAINAERWFDSSNKQQKSLYKNLLKQHLSVLKAAPQNFIKINETNIFNILSH